MKLLRSAYQIVAICLATFGCFKSDTPARTNADGLIAFTTEDLTVRADGVDAAEVAVRILVDASPGRGRITFRSTKGFFRSGAGDSVAVDVTGDKAVAYLSSLQIGEATVTTTVQGLKLTQTRKINFVKAFPERITVSVDSFRVRANFLGEVTVNALLNRNNGGKPSVGHVVTFFAVDDNGGPIGTFLNNVNTGSTNAEGRVSIRYSPGQTPRRGYIIITATTEKEDGTLASATTRVFLTD